MCQCYLYFSIENLTQNFHNGEFSNVNNDFTVTNVRNYKFSFKIPALIDFEACHRLLAAFI